jgi:hypothetical protein
MYVTNKEYLGEYFVSIKMDWYVKLLRNGRVEMDVSGIPFLFNAYSCQKSARSSASRLQVKFRFQQRWNSRTSVIITRGNQSVCVKNFKSDNN